MRSAGWKRQGPAASGCSSGHPVVLHCMSPRSTAECDGMVFSLWSFYLYFFLCLSRFYSQQTTFLLLRKT